MEKTDGGFDNESAQFGADRGRRERGQDMVNVCTVQAAPVTTTDAPAAKANDWKSLPQITTLDFEAGMMWQRAEKIDQWLDQIQIESAVVSTALQT